jgi:hypothetical protein
VCGTCHGAINAEYGSYLDGTEYVPFVPGTNPAYAVYAHFKGSAHGQNMRSKGPGNTDVLTNPSCQPCHTVGWQEPTGFTSSAVTPHLEGIGCEECHGPGSLHAGHPSPANINRTPDASTTCWDCHVPSYKLMRREEPKIITDADLRDKKPSSVSVHHPQAPFVAGWYGYNLPVTPSPHTLIANTCVACHMNPDQGTVQLDAPLDPLRLDAFHGEGALTPDLSTCVPCHRSEQRAKDKFQQFEEEITATLIEIGGASPSDPEEPDESGGGGMLAAYALAHGIALTSNSSPSNQAVKNYKGARHNYEFVLAGAAGGVHNPPFTEALLKEAEALLKD